MSDDVIAIVLAGGRSQRLAGAVPAGGKAALDLDGESMLAWVCRPLAAEIGRVIVVAAEGQPLPLLPSAVEAIRDGRPAAGPLAAIYDGLLYARMSHPAARIAVLASCDVPALAPAVVRLLIERARQPGVEWAVPLVGGHPQVLVSAVATSLLEPITAALAAGETSVRAVLAAVAAANPSAVLQVSEAELAAVDPPLASFADIDTPADLARLRARPLPPPVPPS